MFNLEKEIVKWRKSLHQNQSLEEGYIEELESHLRDLIETYTNSGMSEEKAFLKARNEIGEPEKLGVEFFKTDTTNKVSGRPSWKAPPWMPTMLWSNFKSTIRFFRKNKSYMLVSGICLTIGFISFILIGMYIFDELNFDNFHKDSDRIYRVIEYDKNENSQVRKVAQTAYQVARAAKEDIPGVEDATRLFAIGRTTFGNQGHNRDYERIWIPDSNFFSFFNFKLIHGDPNTALKYPNSVVLTESAARKYFGKTDIIGKRVYTSLFEAVVTGVMKDFPKNSHIGMNMLVSESSFANRFKRWREYYNKDWDSNGIITYLRLNKNVDPESVSNKLKKIVTAKIKNTPETKEAYGLQPLKDIHLYSTDIVEDLNLNKSSSFYIYMFGAIGALLLLIACFNYMNLNISVALKRTKEIAMRKVIGAGHSQVISQFTMEAFLLSFSSLIVALLGVEIILPYLNNYLDKNLSLSMINFNSATTLVIVMLIIIGLTTIYPSFLMLKIRPAEALNSRISINDGKINFKKVLVFLQFAASFIMIFSTIVIYNQLEYMRHKQLGFKINDLLVMDINSNNLRKSYQSFKNEVSNIKEVKSVSATNRVPFEWKNIPEVEVERKGRTKNTEMIFMAADEDFLNTYKIKLLEGRNFIRGKNDSGFVLINSLAAKSLGLDNPVGANLQIPSVRFGGAVDRLDNVFNVNVIGVVNDFHFESFKSEKKPIIISYYKNPIQKIDYYSFRIKTENWNNTISQIRKINKKFDPENPMEFNFLNNKFRSYMETDQKQAQLFLVFSIVSILIASLGLFALVSFTIERKIKEIGIRKVLGASETDIFKMVAIGFMLVVFIGCIAAAPFSYLFMQSWLQNFAYRISITWWMLAAALTGVFLIAFLTVWVKIYKAARMNPVDSIKYE
jgi:putative ABC transport system permease protein